MYIWRVQMLKVNKYGVKIYNFRLLKDMLILTMINDLLRSITLIYL